MKKLALVTAFLVLSTVSGYAVDFSATINDVDGKPIPLCSEKGTDGKLLPECEKPTTLGRIAATALFAEFPSEKDPRTGVSNVGGDEKVKRAALAIEVVNGGNKDLKVEDIALIKKLVALGYAPLIVKRAWDLLDPPKEK